MNTLNCVDNWLIRLSTTRSFILFISLGISNSFLLIFFVHLLVENIFENTKIIISRSKTRDK
jgi:hypothetical protein